MGPYATLTFYGMVLDLSPAQKDWDHLRVIIDVNPHVPSRSRHYLYGEASPVPAMIESCRRLEAYPVDFIVVPCNSASAFLPQVQAEVRTPFLNIMEVTVKALSNQVPQARRVAVLSAVVPYARRIYEPILKFHGLEYVQHALPMQRQSEEVIELIKLNTPKAVVVGKFQALIHALHQDCKVDAVILGCTEFACLGAVSAAVPLIDSSRELARATVLLAHA